MTAFEVMIDRTLPAVVVAVAAVSAYFLARVAVRVAPGKLTRINVEGRRVPAVLGWAILDGAVMGAVVVATYLLVGEVQPTCPPDDICPLVLMRARTLLAWLPLIPVAGMFLAGSWDDLRGDERPRGFGGHLGALRGGAVTGGLVKLVAGAAVALVTVLAVNDWAVLPIVDWLLLAAPIALGANLVNLLDRAPGRALKFFLLCALPLAYLVDAWRLLAAGVVGAAIAVLPFDLRARGMLGDAGANPLGAMLGLGLTLGAWQLGDGAGPSRGALWTIVIVLLALNLASERWSYSTVIERTRWLARLDHLGRK